MLRELTAVHESLPLSTPFRISRGVKTAADVVVAEIRQDGFVGRGEALPYPRYGETVASVLAQIRGMRDAIAGGVGRHDLEAEMPAGAARNALDCALWDLHARQQGQSVAALLNETPLMPIASALTISLDTPDAMRTAAVALRQVPLVKVKVDASNPEAQLRAVRAEVPSARMIVDPNESWSLEILRDMQGLLAELNVDLVEQPLPADQDEVLEGFTPLRPLCADESCHVAADIAVLRRRYQAINIKLDKTGGLTGALELLRAARAANMIVMCGCMISSSLSIAPAFHIARHAAFADLDGPLWLAQDRTGGVRLHSGMLQPPASALWGGGYP
jgi:L-alanine-DL-glutamate epimerase-like enolase superfamily enzyme